MKVAIIGYGKMGKTIEGILLERGHQVLLKISSSNKNELNIENLKQCDVAIEFTQPNSAIANYQVCFQAGVPIVSGTTGWLDELHNVKANMNKHEGALFYAPNFSIGVNLFFAVNQYMAKLMNAFPDYDVEMEEIHHTQKLDSPSGTGIKTAEQIITTIDRKEQWVENVKKNENELLIKVKRIENVPGTHVVSYLSDIDSLEIKHVAHSRKGFAMGAVLAAEFIKGKKGYFEMNDLLKLNL